MRALSWVVVLLAFTVSTADARTKRSRKPAAVKQARKHTQRAKHVAVREDRPRDRDRVRDRDRDRDAARDRAEPPQPQPDAEIADEDDASAYVEAITTTKPATEPDRSPPKPSLPDAEDRDDPDDRSEREHRREILERDDRDELRGRGQSFGLPWAGKLRGATRLRMPEGAYIRRPYRAYGTRTTVEYTRRAILDTLELHPRAHVLSIGDLSSEHGGQVSDHHSHQSGRDVDIGLFYKKQPAGYPQAFINATEGNLDAATTWTLISKLAATQDKDGGVQVIFLDYDVQGIIYRWAKSHGVSERKLDQIFQYPNGRGTPALIHHYRNHQHHLHVRFRCASSDSGCE